MERQSITHRVATDHPAAFLKILFLFTRHWFEIMHRFQMGKIFPIKGSYIYLHASWDDFLPCSLAVCTGSPTSQDPTTFRGCTEKKIDLKRDSPAKLWNVTWMWQPGSGTSKTSKAIFRDSRKHVNRLCCIPTGSARIQCMLTSPSTFFHFFLSASDVRKSAVVTTSGFKFLSN
jgi:hypothetical protein